MIELTHQFVAREDRMLELVVELDRSVRAGAHAKLAVETASDVVHVFGKHPLFFTLLVGYGLGDHLDRSVRAVHLTDPAGYALVLVVRIVRHDQLPAETVEDLQRIAVFGILLGRLLTEENPYRNAHPLQQRRQPAEKGTYVILKSIHIPFVYRPVRRLKNAIRTQR